MMCVEKYIDDDDIPVIGALTEAIAYESYNIVKPAYYDQTLIGRDVKDEESIVCLDIIFGNRCFDVGIYYRIGTYTNKQVAEITGLGKNTVKDIDKVRLEELYTINGKLIKPERQAKYLGIDEFKLHNGRRYATHIIDLETGHILWIANGKKKQVVYDFIDHEIGRAHV